MSRRTTANEGPARERYLILADRRRGGVIAFVMRTDHLSFPEAVACLAAEAKLPIAELSPEERKSRRRWEFWVTGRDKGPSGEYRKDMISVHQFR